jgi:hypothetical protein
MEHGAWSMGHGAWGMEHGAWSMVKCVKTKKAKAKAEAL